MVEEKEAKNKNTKREEHSIRIGPLMKKVLEEQKKIVKETTWDCVVPSDYEAGEIVAKKILKTNNNIL